MRLVADTTMVRPLLTRLPLQRRMAGLGWSGMPCRSMPCHPMPHHATSRCATPRHVMLRAAALHGSEP